MDSSLDFDVLLEASIADGMRQLRVVPVATGDGADALLCVHGDHPNIDPAPGHFTFPSDTLTLTLLSPAGELRWQTDLGDGVIPGVWFCPVFPFDLDADGTEEIWCVTTDDPAHPTDAAAYQLTRIDAETGEITDTWDWPRTPPGRQSLKFRNFVLGGHVDGEPVLVTAQGTYADMYLQGWNADMSRRWEIEIDAYDPGFFETVTDRDSWTVDVAVDDAAAGARGSHMCPVVDLDGDGDDELLWGERLIDLDTGEEIWCADRDGWHGHSDVVQPTLDRENDRWLVYTCRESYTDVSPRVAVYDAEGERVWSAVDEGHMHVGWTARLGEDGEHVAMAGRNKWAPHDELDEFVWDAYDGAERAVEFPVYSTAPVDIDGDGRHELVYRMFDRAGLVVDGHGEEIGRADEHVAHGQPSKLLDHPGEQLVTYADDGTVRVWGDRNAVDSEQARERYDHPYYRKSQRLSAVGYNWRNLGGL